MANYPLITWETEFPAFDVQVGTGSPVPINAGAGYGFELATTPNIASTGSAIGYLAQQLDTVAGISATSAVFDIVNNTIPATSPLTATLTYTCASPIVLTFASDADAAVYGFASTTVNLSSGSPATVTTTFNVGAVWSPCGVAGDVRRTTVQRAAASSSEMSGLSTDVVNWGKVANLEFMSSIFPAANLTRWYAQIEVFYDAAQRNKFDPNNTLEGLLEAAATGVTFRLYRSASDNPPGTTPEVPNEARMPMIAERSAVADYAQADDEPRLWSTTGMFFRGNT
jgi:hypothetical protein